MPQVGAKVNVKPGGGSGTVSQVQSGDATVSVTGGAGPTVNLSVATVLLGYLKLIGGSMTGAIAMGANKITGLANGSASTDAAAFGQIPVPANGYGIGGNTGLTPTPAVALATGESYIAGTVTLTTGNTIYNVTSVALAAGTWLITGRLSIQNANTSFNINVDAWLGANSASASGAYAGATATTGQNAVASGDMAELVVTKIVTLASPASVYLNAVASQSGAVVQFQSIIAGVANASGITAVRIS
jgi:hypothetical protein